MPTSSHTPAPAAHCHGSKVRIELVSDRGPGANLIFWPPPHQQLQPGCSHHCLSCNASGFHLCSKGDQRDYDGYCTIDEGDDEDFRHDSGGLEVAANLDRPAGHPKASAGVLCGEPALTPKSCR